MRLNHLTQRDIDFNKWDASLAKSHKPLIYAQCWYLDIVSPNWEALVSDDYSIMIPLPVKRIAGIKIIIQSPFCQQLGLFSYNQSGVEIKKMPFLTLAYQTRNLFVQTNTLLVKELVNLTLPLHNDYPLVQQGFNQNTRRNIRSAQKFPQKIEQATCADAFISFSQQHTPYESSANNWEVLRSIVNAGIINGCGTIWAVVDEDHTPLSMAFFLNDYNRITFLSGYSSPQGFTQRSMFLLMNHIIKKNAGSNTILDFEGGRVDGGVSRFYRGFGAVEENYYTYQHPFANQLLATAKWIIEKRRNLIRLFK